MKEAIRQAKKADALEEVPIGCVIVHQGKIMAEDITEEQQIKIPLACRTERDPKSQ